MVPKPSMHKSRRPTTRHRVPRRGLVVVVFDWPDKGTKMLQGWPLETASLGAFIQLRLDLSAPDEFNLRGSPDELLDHLP